MNLTLADRSLPEQNVEEEPEQLHEDELKKKNTGTET